MANSRSLGVASVLFALAMISLPRTAAAFCRMTTEGGAQIGDAACVERGAPFFWANPCLSYAIDQNGSQWMELSDVQAAIDLSFEAWENVDCGNGQPPNLVFAPLESSSCRRAEYNCSGNVNTIAFLDPWKDECSGLNEPGYDAQAFAVTIVWHNTTTGEILDADMMINDKLATRFSAGGPYDDCPDTGCTGNFADLRSIVTHEAGHFIGIGHCNPIDENDPNDPCVQATMYSTAERDSVEKRTLAPDDMDAVCTIYPPGNLSQQCDWTPKGGLELDCESTACTDGPCNANGGSSGGCSATGSPSDAPWALILAAMVGLTARRRRRALRS